MNHKRLCQTKENRTNHRLKDESGLSVTDKK